MNTSRPAPRAGGRSWLPTVTLVCAVLGVTLASAQTPPLPELTAPVNDFARVIDGASRADIDRMIRALKAASGDVVVVATVPSIEGYGDIREYAN